MDGEDKQKELLISWKEIADYLDCKVRSCQSVSEMGKRSRASSAQIFKFFKVQSICL